MVSHADWKIVLIDDEEDIREILAITLQDSGYHVKTAADGASGLLLCEEFSPQIVITDIRMPGVDGLQVLETVKRKYPDTEVVVATAFGEMDLAIRALQLDASDFITKPIGDETLYLALKRAQNRFTSKKQLQDYTALLEKEKAETSQELLKSIAFQRNLIESSMDGILGCDENDTTVTFNQSMERIIGYTKAEAIHKMTLGQFFAAGGRSIARSPASPSRPSSASCSASRSCASMPCAGSSTPSSRSASPCRRSPSCRS